LSGRLDRPGRSRAAEVRFTLVGVGAMASPRYRPAGVLVTFAGRRVMIDGGLGSDPEGPVDAWLITDERGELVGKIRKAARQRGTEAAVSRFSAAGVAVEPRPVVHTNHLAFGYLIRLGRRRAAWAPEFWKVPRWAAGADLLFAEAAGWSRPIRFRGGVGGHAAALDVARQAEAQGVRRLVFVHIGRPTIRAIDAGEAPPFGEFGAEKRSYRLRL
jgi:hypothetical protein